MNWWLKKRLAFARRLVAGTRYVVVLDHELELVGDTLEGLNEYVESSGSLTHPRRVSARKKIRRKVDTALGHLTQSRSLPA